MKTLYLLRHAHSGKDHPSLKDHERPLSEKGQRQTRIMGELFVNEKINPDLIISSTALRAKQTAELAVKINGYKGKIFFTDELYEANINKYIQILEKISDEFISVMLVGHNPSHEEFLWKLTGQETHLSTATLAWLNLPINHWKEIRHGTTAALKLLLNPKNI